ncbi:MAG: hydrogenase nickel incorporation protein HypB [Gemmatimonadota bacterium]|nr:hydrogenase nickel incorporation protein HypB [Gemmatimonadota bacterium]
MGSIILKDKVLTKNDQFALENRALLDRHNVWCLNLISSPGSGKTTLIEHTVDRLADKYSMGVLVGDLETENDARRIAEHGVPVRQIITGGSCHLNAKTIGEFLNGFDLDSLKVMIIENVGNLVCPTSYHLGEHDRVCLISSPEGDDKPLKYPGAIHTSDLLVLTKLDLSPYTDFNVRAARDNALRIKSGLPVLELSCKSGQGLEKWFEWFESRAGSFGK